MGLFNNKNIIRLVYLTIVYFIFPYICTTQVNATGTLITAKIIGILSSCTTKETNPQLPNLSFGNRTVQFTVPATCLYHGLSTNPAGYTEQVAWYSSISPPPADCCGNSTCHSIDVSTYNITARDYEAKGSNVIITTTGFITNGPYSNSPYNFELVVGLTNQLACNTTAGLEISTGSITFDITNGPTCTGIQVEEYCPGVHF